MILDRKLNLNFAGRAEKAFLYCLFGKAELLCGFSFRGAGAMQDQKSQQNQFLRYKNGQLHFFDGVSELSLASMVKNYQGPIFFYSLKFIKSRAVKMQAALKDVRLFYAMKANAHPKVLGVFKDQKVGIDVVSGGEIKHAIKCGFEYKDLVYSGVGKTKKELELAIANEIYQINVESIPELQRIAEIASELKKKANVAFRINPDISIKSHPYIATGLKDNKFGIDTGQLGEVVAMARAHSVHLSVRGLSLHLGSQMMEFDSLKDSLAKLKLLFLNIRAEFPDCNRFDFGGGLGVFYEKQDLIAEEKMLADYAAVVFSELAELKNHIPDLEIQSEPGRWLVSHSGVLISQVQYVKKTPYKEFVIVDSGMNHLIRPSLYEAFHGIQAMIDGPEKMYDVVGPICESSDFFGKNRKVAQVREGDFIVIRDCGAYGASMSSDYNMQERAFEVTDLDF